MTDISVKPDRVEATAAGVAEGVRGIEQQLQTLEGARARLVGQWTGEAADAYDVAQTGWARDMQTLADVGHRAAEAARTAAEAYRDADDTVGRLWGV